MMTVSEFRRAHESYAESVVSHMAVILVLSIFISRLIERDFFPKSTYVTIAIAAASIVLLTVAREAFFAWKKRMLEKKHPEMSYIDSWHLAELQDCDYPLTEDEKMRYADRAAITLLKAAEVANRIFAERDAIRARMNRAARGSIEREAMSAILGEVGTLAKRANFRYLNLFELFTAMGILSGREYSDPRRYRESLKSWK